MKYRMKTKKLKKKKEVNAPFGICHFWQSVCNKSRTAEWIFVKSDTGELY
jgi:hypothetical protein